MTAAFNDDYQPAPVHKTQLELVASGELDEGGNWHEYPSPSRPYDVAQRATKEMFTTQDSGLKTLIYWSGDFWRYTGTHYALVKDELEVKELLWQRLNRVHYLGKEGEELPWSPTTAKINGLIEPLKILNRVDSDMPAPSWLPQSDTFGLDAKHVISTANGLLDLKGRYQVAHTPGLFTTWSLPFDYDPTAQCARWHKFLEEVFAHDPKGADLLQEFAGYLISGRTDLHKALLVIGPPRGGKGVISHIVQQLIGTANSVSPSLNALASEFGLEGLIGKPLAVVEDARSTDKQNIIVERLLNITSEDEIGVNRKGIPYWYGQLPTRIMMFSNEMPRLFDSSGAITTRFMSIRLKQSFVDNPDPHLKDKLRAELPGIFNWALQGLDRLNHNNGVFTRPDTMDEMQDLMSDMSSPINRFFEEEYDVTGDLEDVLEVSTVMEVFKQWWEDQGGDKAPNRDTFISRATAAVPELVYKNTHLHGTKKRWFFGIRTKAPLFSPIDPLGTGSIGSSS